MPANKIVHLTSTRVNVAGSLILPGTNQVEGLPPASSYCLSSEAMLYESSPWEWAISVNAPRATQAFNSLQWDTAPELAAGGKLSACVSTGETHRVEMKRKRRNA